LVGGKYLMTTRALAERIAAKAGKLAFVSLFTELGEAEALRIYVKLLDKVALGSDMRRNGLRNDIESAEIV
jgi:hypothetical protein